MILSIFAVATSAGALAYSVITRRKLDAKIAKLKNDDGAPRELTAAPDDQGAEPGPGPAVVIFNPTKSADFDYLKLALGKAAADAGMAEPVWIATTEKDTGAGQTRKALEMNPPVVIAAGGDGTVRAVAQELVGTGVPLGLLPVGTGNLLARNLGLPLESPRAMALAALTGVEREIDVGWLTLDEPTSTTVTEFQNIDDLPDGAQLAPAGRFAFMVNAGIGFDADLIAEADSELKSKIGWPAYLKAAIPHLLSEKMTAEIRTGDGTKRPDSGAAESGTGALTVQARSVMFLNCAELIAGINIAPETHPDDGWLEIAVLDTRGGLLGWADLVRRVGLNGLGLHAKPYSELDASMAGGFDFHRVHSGRIDVDAPRPVQVDGDILGYAKRMSATIEPGALRVRIRA